MSNAEQDPVEEICRSRSGPAFEVLAPREVPLGGPRAMLVRRTLPQRQRSLIGAWCFVDHYGPDRVSDTGGMSVAPHPHTGLQTVSWLFTGEIDHRDSVGTVARVRPGEVNLMTAGHGISHSEVSTPETGILHGAQLWVALPEHARDTAPGFENYAPDPVLGAGWQARVFLGSALGSASPVRTFTELLGVELLIDPGQEVEVDLDERFEVGVLVDAGPVEAEGNALSPGDLGYFAPGRSHLRIRAEDAPARILLLGGPPFGEQIVMWWNFVGRSHEEISDFREAWQRQITVDGSGTGPLAADGQQVHQGRFAVVAGELLPPIPAPALPNARLRLRS